MLSFLEFHSGTLIATAFVVRMLCPFKALYSQLRLESEPMTLNREIYPNLKLRMYTTGIRQNRLARMLGIHEASLSRIMNGFREPTSDLRTQLAEILQSDPDWLFHKIEINDEVAAMAANYAPPQ